MFTIEIFVGSSVKRILLENAEISTGTPCGGLKKDAAFLSERRLRLYSFSFYKE